MDSDIAVSVKSVSKRFLLPHEKKNSVKSLFTSFFKTKTSYSNQQALKDISFEIKKGEFFGIVGRNGSGKSTLLKIIAGIYQPTKGRVTTNGRLVPFIELGVGFNPELTGRENVFLNGAILGFTRKQIQANYKTIVEFAELEAFMDQKLKNYSSGMQVRLAFACATMAEADILLVDEVLAVGDADFQRKCFSYFRELKKLKKTVIFVTHDMSSVKEYCDRAILINESELAFEGSAEKVAEQYSKLFANKNELGQSGDSDRWGNQLVKITSVPTIDITKNKIKIKNIIRADEELVLPLIGFRVENESGVAIIGTNNVISGYKIDKFTTETLTEIEWEFDNILSTGRYYFTFSIQSRDGSVVYDWWTNAASVRVDNASNTPYPISPSIKLTKEKK